MEPVPFPEANCTFTAPRGDPEVMELPTHVGDGFILSKWRLTLPEIARLMETGVLWVWVKGEGMPPISISTENPFKEDGSG